MDVVYLLLAVAFFVATALLITGCEALRGQS
jgi:predicted small secreted protein